MVAKIFFIAVGVLLSTAANSGRAAAYEVVQDPYEYKPLRAFLVGPTLSPKRAAIESTFLLFPFELMKSGASSIFAPGFGLTGGWSSDHFAYYEVEWFQPILSFAQGHSGGGSAGLILTASGGMMQKSGETIGSQYTISLNGSFMFIGTPAFYWRHMQSDLVTDKDEFGILIKIPLWYEKHPKYPASPRPLG